MSGIKGKSGRKGKLAELNHYAELLDLFNEPAKLSKIQDKIASGKYSAKDMLKLKLMTGDRESIIAVFRKLFPDSIIQDIQTRSEFEGINLNK